MPVLSDDPTSWSAASLAAALQSRRLSPIDLVEGFLARIGAADGRLHAFCALYAHELRLAAEAADKAIRSGHAVGPLQGIPVALKDLVDVGGRVTAAGSAAWRDRVAERSATVTDLFVKAGLIVLGKTHTVEFASGGWGTNRHLGTPWNPWDMAQALAPGGSSSGSAVAVASRLVPWAIGTDTGGSVRVPAAYCGISGLKPTRGRCSLQGVTTVSQTLDTVGPMARSVEDLALLYRLMQGPDPGDARTIGHEPDDPMPILRRGVAGLRLGRMPAVEREGVAAAVLDNYDRALDLLAGLGAEIVPLSLPRRFADYARLTGRIMLAETYCNFRAEIDDPDLTLDEDIRSRIKAGGGLSATEYLTALSERTELTEEFARLLAPVDALLTPTAETTAMTLSDIDQSQIPTRFTRFVNLLDLCALALPNGQDGVGLPTSLQIVCRGFAEATALRIGWAFQQASEWHHRTPPGAAIASPAAAKS